MASTGHAKVMAKREVMSTVFGAPRPQALVRTDGAAPQGGVSCHICKIVAFPSMQAAFCHYESQEHRRNKLMAACGAMSAPTVPSVPASPQVLSAPRGAAAPAVLLPPPPPMAMPKLPSSVLICRADEDFAQFCEKHGLYKPDSEEAQR
ncbi:unnamed protein product [Ixodes hexagonus]